MPFFYGWVVAGFSFLSLFALFGIRISFGGYITPWEAEFGSSRTAVTTISLFSFITIAMAQPFTGRLTDRFGARAVLTASMFLTGISLLACAMANQIWQLAILYGFFVSWGVTGGSNVTATAVITHWFTANRGLAIGLAMSGMAFGQFAIVPLSLYLIANYGWRLTIGSIGLVLLVVFMPLMYLFVRSRPEDIGLKPAGEMAAPEVKAAPVPAPARVERRNESIWSIFRQRAFLQLTIPYFFCGFTDAGLIDTHFIPFAEGKGFSLGFVAFAFSVIGVANILGTIGTGYLADRWHRGRLLTSIYAIRGATFLLIMAADSPPLLILFALTFGITEMAAIAPTSSLCAHLFSRYPIGAIIGFVSLTHQLGGALGSLVPSLFYDLTGSYTAVFLISIVLMAGAALIVSRVPDTQG